MASREFWALYCHKAQGLLGSWAVMWGMGGVEVLDNRSRTGRERALDAGVEAAIGHDCRQRVSLAESAQIVFIPTVS